MGTPAVVASAPLAALLPVQVPVEAPLTLRAASDAGLPTPTASLRCSRPGKSPGSALSETGMSPKTSRIALRRNFQSAAPRLQAALPALRSLLAGGQYRSPSQPVVLPDLRRSVASFQALTCCHTVPPASPRPESMDRRSPARRAPGTAPAPFPPSAAIPAWPPWQLPAYRRLG